ncbi:MAG: VOC family protein, partial [Bacillota bacterium]
MEFQLTTIHVDNLEESKEFYQNILQLKEVKKLNPRQGVEISFLQDQQGGTIELIAGEDISSEG